MNIIGGFLGVGKTTAINSLLRQKPPHERWAILVNEYGEVGIDEALFPLDGEEKGFEVRQLAGGCICCSASFILHGYILILLQQYKPDRLIVEPTGLATLSGILETLAKPGVAEAVELRTIITLVDPSMWVHSGLQEQEAWRDQLEKADVLLANRCDLASAETLQQFEEEIQRRYPSKAKIEYVHNAELKLDFLDLVVQTSSGLESSPTTTPMLPHDGDRQPENAQRALLNDQEFSSFVHEAKDAKTYGWIFSPKYTFCPVQIEHLIDVCGSMPGFLRLKGVFNTENTWTAYNVTAQQLTTSLSGARKDSRVELIFQPTNPVSASEIEQKLTSCCHQEL